MEQTSLDYSRALYEIAAEVYSSTAPDDVLDGIVKSAAKAMQVKGCSLMLLTPNRKQLIHTAAYGLSDSYISKGPLKLDPIIAKALKGTPMVVSDVNTDPRVQYRTQAQKEGITSMLSLPVMLRGEITGVLRIYTAEKHEFSPDDIEFLSLVSNLGAIALEKARQYESQGQFYEQRLSEKMQQLEHAADELNELEGAKNKLLAFISMAAHDLKAPLSAIQTYFDVLLDGFAGELDRKQKEIIERSSTRVDGLFELISDLLDICRMETTQVVSEMKEVSLSELAEVPVEDALKMAEEKGLTMTADIPLDLPSVYGSPIRLKQVFTNLLSNAIKFTPEGGTATVKLWARGSTIVGEVQDSGIGIPKEDHPHIFDDFFRARNACAPGTGLGLSIVKRIIEAHGGQIRAESPCRKDGTGSKFTFVLPITGN